jgi:hypothetical protein
MKRLVRTSTGSLIFDAHHPSTSLILSVDVVAFDNDGWGCVRGRVEPGPESRAAGALSTFRKVIEATGGVPREEAEGIARRFLADWEQRGPSGPRANRRTNIAMLTLMFGLAALGLAVLVAVLIWLVL